MSHIFLNDLLHKTVKNLHTLHDYEATDDSFQYEVLLRETIEQVLRLLNYSHKSHFRLNLSVSPPNPEIGSLDLLYYTNADTSHTDSLANVNLVQFINSFQKHGPSTNHTVLTSLVDLLSNLNGKRPTRIKDSYSSILVKLSGLIEFFIKLQQESEAEIVHFLTRCISYEIRYYHQLHHQLDILNDEDTQQLSIFLDNIISGKESNDHFQDENNSIFSYDSLSPSKPVQEQKLSVVKFQCHNEVLNQIYGAFLKILSIKKPSESDYPNYIRVMLSLFKKHSSIEFIELDTFSYKEMKLSQFFNFFSGDPSSDGFSILPEYYAEISNRVLSQANIFPEMQTSQEVTLPSIASPRIGARKNDPNLLGPSGLIQQIIGSNYYGHPTQPSDHEHMNYELPNKPSQRPYAYPIYNGPGIEREELTPINHPYSKEDQIRIYNNLKHIVPLLNEFDLNFDELFPYTFKYYMTLLYEDLPTHSVGADLKFVEEIVHLVNQIVDFENEDSSDEDFNIKSSVSKFHKAHQYLGYGLPNISNRTVLMKIAVWEFFRHRDMKLNSFRIWIQKHGHLTTLNDRLESQWIIPKQRIGSRNILQNWFVKKEKVNNLEVVASKFHSTIGADKSMTNWKKKMRLYDEVNALASTYSIRSFYSRWKNRSSRYEVLRLKATKHEEVSIERRQFANLVRNFNRIIELNEIAIRARDEFDKKKSEDLIARIWSSWYNRMNDGGSRISALRGSLRKNEVSHLDSKRSPSQNTELSSGLADKVNRLAVIERSWIQSRFYSTWKINFKLRSAFHNVQINNDRVLMRYILNEHWKVRTEMKRRANELCEKTNSQLKKKFLKSWKEKKIKTDIAISFDRKNILGKSFKVWTINHNLKSIQSDDLMISFEKSNLKIYFQKWIMKSKLDAFESQKSIANQRILLSRWIYKYAYNNSLTSRSLEFNSEITLGKRFREWSAAKSTIQEFQKISDLNLQRKFYNKIQKRVHTVSVNYAQKAEFYLQKRRFQDRYLLNLVLARWRSHYHRKFEEALADKAHKFQKTIIEPKIKLSIVKLWLKKHDARKSKTISLEKKLNDHIKKSRTKLFFFSNWVENAREKVDLNLRAVHFQNSVLLKKFLLIWYDQFITKGIYLGEIADDFIDNKEFRQVHNMLSHWSMKYIKLVKRNQQSCDIFIERWQNVKAKSIFELWLYKFREMKLEEVADDSFEEAETSLSTIQSPLANKTSRSLITQSANATRRDKGFQNDDTSYLFTPLKSQFSRTIVFTPKSYLSPTKLEETTQRMKNERIGRLRKYYGNSKSGSLKSSTPKRDRAPVRIISPSEQGSNQLSQTRFESLLPKPTPRTRKQEIDAAASNQSTSSLGKISRQDSSSSTFDQKFSANVSSRPKSYNSVMPPKPPNFESLIESMDYDAEYSPPTKLQSSSSRTTIENEKSVIENAKKLRRITPIMFPTEDEISQPKFSPVRKLKERLRNNLMSVSASPDDNPY